MFVGGTRNYLLPVNLEKLSREGSVMSSYNFQFPHSLALVRKTQEKFFFHTCNSHIEEAPPYMLNLPMCPYTANS